MVLLFLCSGLSSALPYQCPWKSALPSTFPKQQQLPHTVLSHQFFSFLTSPAGCTLLPQCLGWYLHPFPVCLVGHPNMDSLTKVSPKGMTSSFQSNTSHLTRKYGFTPESAASATQTYQGNKENSFQVSAAWKTPHCHGMYENPAQEGDPRASHCVLVQRGGLLSPESGWEVAVPGRAVWVGNSLEQWIRGLYQLISQTFTNSN